jgi:hypothetical protein
VYLHVSLYFYSFRLYVCLQVYFFPTSFYPLIYFPFFGLFFFYSVFLSIVTFFSPRKRVRILKWQHRRLLIFALETQFNFFSFLLFSSF